MRCWATRACKSVTITTALALLHLLCASLPASAADASPPSMSCGPSSRYVVGYYPTWKRSSLMNVDMSKISHLQVAFGIPTDSGDFAFDGDWFLPNLVREARREMTKITVSIGGWTGSNRLSTIMRDTHKRAALIKSIGTFVEKYELDGIDFDWEYPGRQGSKCNKFYPAEDSGNLLRFLRALRASFHARFPDDQKLISLAVRVQPFDNEGGPMKDVSAFAEYVDFASIMAFDINGVWSNTTGPNAPLDHQRNRGLPYSLSQAVDEWLDAKWPADKLVAGVAFYGRSLTTHGVMTPKEGANMYAPFVKEVPQGDNEDAMWYDVCENVNSMSGVWHYKHLRDQGILKTANTTTDDWVRVWDEKTSTPWLYNPQTRRFISYDDPESLGKKVEYVRKKGLKGMMTWSLHGDYNGELINVLGTVGPLCRGKQTPNDTDPNAAATTSSSKSSSSWTQSAPFASFTSTHTSDTSSSSSRTSRSGGSSSSSTEKPPTSTLSNASSSESASASSSESTSSSSSSASSDAASSASSNSSVSQQQSSPDSSESPGTQSAAASSSSATGMAILFDSVGVPYAMIDGKSSSVPPDLADKLMKLADQLPTASSSSGSANTSTPSGSDTASTGTDSSASGSMASSDTSTQSNNDTIAGVTAMPMPVADDGTRSRSNLMSGLRPGKLDPRKPIWNQETNIFDTPQLGKSSNSQGTKGLSRGSALGMASPTAPPLSAGSSQTGFAATFFLTLDTKSQPSGMQTTTVIQISQMMATRTGLLSSLSGGSWATAGSSSGSDASAASASASASTSASASAATPSLPWLPTAQQESLSSASASSSGTEPASASPSPSPSTL